MTERHVRHDPPTSAELDALAQAAREAFRALPPVAPSVAVIGVAGTVTTLAAVSLGLVPYDGGRVHGQRLSTGALREVVKHLACLPVDARRSVPGMHPKRADVIVAGGVIALELLDSLQAPTVIVSDRGVRWGLAEELAQHEGGA